MESPLISVQGLTKTVASRVLFQNLSLGLESREHIGLIGPNGAGKTTLLRILAGLETADKGSRSPRRHLHTGYVEQDPQVHPQHSLEEALRIHLEGGNFPADELDNEVARALNQLNLDAQTQVSTLSGGWRKRLAICAQIARQPDLLFLDEPTNHLDIEGIKWLEKRLKSFRGAFLLISHDRTFLETVCSRLIELNPRYREGYFSCPGNYSHFLQKRAEHLIAMDQYEQSLANKVRREMAWLRQGVKARTTKSKSRQKRAHGLQDELATLKEQKHSPLNALEFHDRGRKSKKLITAQQLEIAFNDQTVFSNLSLEITAGSRWGLVGPNGCGKSSLLKIFARHITSFRGQLDFAEDLKVVHFTQDRNHINDHQTIAENLSDTDHVIYQGRSLHVNSYLRRFLFRPEQLHLPAQKLSGGEKARLMIAQLMLREADVLLLDEPTNDLDIETMDTFAESLLEFKGALILVSHDRFFLEHVAKDFLALEPGRSPQHYAELSQWEAEKAHRLSEKSAAKPSPSRRPVNKSPKRLSYHEKREWEQMEERILTAEDALEHWRSAVEDPKIISVPEKLQEAFHKMSEAQKLVDQLYARWAELESRQKI